MLYLDSSLEIEGLTLYREYDPSNRSKRFFYMPRSPQIVVEAGQPLFQLLIFRRDVTDNPEFHEGDHPGGGFLTMTVGLGVSQGTLDAVKAQLRNRVGDDVDLVPVPFESGTVRVSALGTAVGAAPALEGDTQGDGEGRARFVERIVGAANCSRYADNRAVFTIELSREGATLMRASLEDEGASQVAVIYDVTFRGLNPAYEAQITIDYKQSYQYLRNRLTLNTLWFKSEIDNETERMVKEGHIKITEVDYLSSDRVGNPERTQRLNDLAKELATFAFFRPGLQPGKVLASDRGELKTADPTEAAGTVTAGFSTPLAVALTGKGQAEPGASMVPGTTDRAAGIGGQDATEGAQNVTPAEGQGGAAGTPERPLTAVEQWNRAGRPQGTFLLKSLSQEEQQTVTYDLRQVAATMRSAAPQGAIRLIAGTASLRGRIKEVDLQDSFFERISGTVTTSADLKAAGIASMVVKLRYGVRDDGTAPKDTQEIVLRQTGDQGSYSFFLDSRFSVELEYQVVISYQAGFALGDPEAQATSAWIRTTTRNLDIDPGVAGAVLPVSVVVGQVDWAAVRGIQTVLDYQDPVSGVRGQRTLVLNQANPSGVVPIRPRDPAVSRFRATTTWFYASTQEVVTQEGDAPSTLVLNQPASKAVPVAITAADPLGRFRKLTVELSYDPKDGSPPQTGLLELTGQGASATWTFFRAAAEHEVRYGYRVTAFGTDGTTSTGGWTETIERGLVVGDRYPGMLQVEVRFIGGRGGDLTASGYQGALLSLEYPDAPAGVDGVEQEFFSGLPAPYLWRVPMSDLSARTYRHATRFIRSDGSELVKDGESKDEVLLLMIPTEVS
jgi:hypothetical protein